SKTHGSSAPVPDQSPKRMPATIRNAEPAPCQGTKAAKRAQNWAEMQFSSTSRRRSALHFQLVLLCFAGVRVVGRVFDEYGRARHHFETECVLAGGMERDTEGLALPLGRSAGGVRARIFLHGIEFFRQDRLAGGQLRHHRVEALAARGEAAVGGVVTEPCDLADGGIVVRELDCA